MTTSESRSLIRITLPPEHQQRHAIAELVDQLSKMVRMILVGARVPV